MTNIKVITKKGINTGKKIVILAGVHGDEICGVKAFDELIPKIGIDSGEVTFIYANLEAQKQVKRFIEYDLNRCFLENLPFEIKETLEGKTAEEIKPFLKKADILLDLHSSKTSNSLKYILCEKDCFNLISVLSPENVILGIKDFQKGGSDGYMASQGKQGVCIECGLDKSQDSIELAKESIINILIKTKNIFGTNKETSPKKLFKTKKIYINKNKPFKLTKEFKDFEKFSRKTLIGYEGNKKVFFEKGDIILFPKEHKEITKECFLVLSNED